MPPLTKMTKGFRGGPCHYLSIIHSTDEGMKQNRKNPKKKKDAHTHTQNKSQNKTQNRAALPLTNNELGPCYVCRQVME